MKYRLKINSAEYDLNSSQELRQHLSFAYQAGAIRLEITQWPDAPRKPTLMTRLLFKLMKMDASLIAVENEIYAWKQGHDAILFYLEAAGNGYHSIDPDYSGTTDDVIVFRPNNDEPIQHPKSWVITTEQVKNAFLEFYETGRRPSKISWEKIELPSI